MMNQLVSAFISHLINKNNIEWHKRRSSNTLTTFIATDQHNDAMHLYKMDYSAMNMILCSRRMSYAKFSHLTHVNSEHETIKITVIIMNTMCIAISNKSKARYVFISTVCGRFASSPYLHK